MLGTMEERTKGMKRQSQELIEQAYNRGYKAAKENIKSDTESRVAELMEIGRNEAWEVADKLNRMSMDEVIKVFKDDPLVLALTRESIFSSCSPELAIEKLRKYENKKQEDSEIHVGDEVQYLGELTGIVTYISETEGFSILWEDGSVGKRKYTYDSDFRKTGRTFPEIVEVLKKMQEETNES